MMPSNQPENQEQSVPLSTAVLPMTPAEHRQSRQMDAKADRIVSDWVSGLNEAVMQRKHSDA